MNEIIERWHEFYVAEVGASAALSGLVIVAISINVQRILSLPTLPGRAGESLTILVGALMVSSIALVPQTSALFGAETLAIGLALAATAVVLQAMSVLQMWPQPLRYWFTRALVSVATAVPFIVGGLLIVLGNADGLAWIAAGVLISLGAGMLNTWVLLIEILR